MLSMQLSFRSNGQFLTVICRDKIPFANNNIRQNIMVYLQIKKYIYFNIYKSSYAMCFLVSFSVICFLSPPKAQFHNYIKSGKFLNFWAAIEIWFEKFQKLETIGKSQRKWLWWGKSQGKITEKNLKDHLKPWKFISSKCLKKGDPPNNVCV